MKLPTCNRGHELVTLAQGVTLCECGPQGKGYESRKGMQEEVERLVARAGGLDALRARERRLLTEPATKARRRR